MNKMRRVISLAILGATLIFSGHLYADIPSGKVTITCEGDNLSIQVQAGSNDGLKQVEVTLYSYTDCKKCLRRETEEWKKVVIDTTYLSGVNADSPSALEPITTGEHSYYAQLLVVDQNGHALGTLSYGCVSVLKERWGESTCSQCTAEVPSSTNLGIIVMVVVLIAVGGIFLWRRNIRLCKE